MAAAAAADVQGAVVEKGIEVMGQMVDKQLQIIDEAQEKAENFLKKEVRLRYHRLRTGSRRGRKKFGEKGEKTSPKLKNSEPSDRGGQVEVIGFVRARPEPVRRLTQTRFSIDYGFL